MKDLEDKCLEKKKSKWREVCRTNKKLKNKYIHMCWHFHKECWKDTKGSNKNDCRWGWGMGGNLAAGEREWDSLHVKY